MTPQGIYILENFFFDNECEEAVHFIKENHAGESSIKMLPEIAEHYRTRVLARMPDKLIMADGTKVKVYGVMNDITLGIQHGINIAFHKDETKHIDNTFKLTVYVNDVSSGGGTEFRIDGENNFVVEHKKGNAILFDMNLIHGGLPFPRNEQKMTIGYRILTEKIVL